MHILISFCKRDRGQTYLVYFHGNKIFVKPKTVHGGESSALPDKALIQVIIRLFNNNRSWLIKKKSNPAYSNRLLFEHEKYVFSPRQVPYVSIAQDTDNNSLTIAISRDLPRTRCILLSINAPCCPYAITQMEPLQSFGQAGSMVASP
jgi:hypothetical protein